MGYKRQITLYLNLRRAERWHGNNNITLLGATTSPPKTRPKGSVVVKVKIVVPDEAFDPATIPSLVADIPLESLMPTPDDLEVVIEDPRES
jgi:hypothetical protein